MVSTMVDKSCPQCGTSYPYENEVCPSCGYQVPPSPPCTEKNPWLAALLSVFFFGAGQAYNGQIQKGIALLILVFLGLFVFLVPGILVWAYGIYDAANSARKMNAREITCIPTQVGRLVLFIFIVLLIYVAIGITVAGYAGRFAISGI
jgi:TM2 domain-containing membrane protein YozV